MTSTSPTAADPRRVTGELWLSRCYCQPHDRREDLICQKCGIRWVRRVLILARVSTGRYEFEVLAETEEQAKSLLLDAYAGHAAQNPYADPDVMAQLLDEDEIEFRQFPIGSATRDGEPI